MCERISKVSHMARYSVTNGNIYIFFTQYVTQIVQIQTQPVHTHDRRDNKLIFW